MQGRKVAEWGKLWPISDIKEEKLTSKIKSKKGEYY